MLLIAEADVEVDWTTSFVDEDCPEVGEKTSSAAGLVKAANRSSSETIRSRSSVGKFVDLNPILGLSPKSAEYGVCLMPE